MLEASTIIVLKTSFIFSFPLKQAPLPPGFTVLHQETPFPIRLVMDSGTLPPRPDDEDLLCV